MKGVWQGASFAFFENGKRMSQRPFTAKRLQLIFTPVAGIHEYCFIVPRTFNHHEFHGPEVLSVCMNGVFNVIIDCMTVKPKFKKVTTPMR